MISSGDFGLVIRMLVSTGAVLGLLLFMARLARKGKLNGVLSRVSGGGTVHASSRRGISADQGQSMRILHKQSITRESVILQIQFGTEELLVAMSSNSATVLSRVEHSRSANSENTGTESVRTAAGDVDSFTEAFSNARRTNDAEDAVAGALVGTGLVERLRNATTVRTNLR